MCGRFSITFSDLNKIAFRFDAIAPPLEWKSHYNFAPTQETVTVVNWNNKRQLTPMQWGLFPYWSQKGNPLINIRSESLTTKPSLKEYLHQRCLIPADGFFEWREENRHKVPYRAIIKNEPLFAFAGIWDQKLLVDGTVVRSFAIVTTEANLLLYPIHNRMPVILTKEGENLWIEEGPVKEIHSLFKPYPSEEMELFRVSPEVNSVKNDNARCIQPLG